MEEDVDLGCWVFFIFVHQGYLVTYIFITIFAWLWDQGKDGILK